MKAPSVDKWKVFNNIVSGNTAEDKIFKSELLSDSIKSLVITHYSNLIVSSHPYVFIDIDGKKYKVRNGKKTLWLGPLPKQELDASGFQYKYAIGFIELKGRWLRYGVSFGPLASRHYHIGLNKDGSFCKELCRMIS